MLTGIALRTEDNQAPMEEQEVFEGESDVTAQVMGRWTALVNQSEETLTQGAMDTFVFDGSDDRHLPTALSSLPLLDSASVDGEAREFDFSGTLGQGGMGVVMLATQSSLGREVAVKMPLADAFIQDEHLPAFLREAWMIGYLEHPNIVPIYSLGRNEQGRPMIVMKRIGGHSWEDLLRDDERIPGEEEVDKLEWHLQILMQVCNAVNFAHSRGIIHRDLKPANVMVGDFGEVYVLDWGIAVSIAETVNRRMPRALDISGPSGTPAYMAPEMTLGQGELLSERTDVFLLGAILHQLITGEPPYRERTTLATVLAAHNCDGPVFDDHVPSELAGICKRAMAREPSNRFASASELRDALGHFLRHRESSELTRQALARLAQLRDHVGVANAEAMGAGAAMTHRIFGECRFAFEQALRDWPENEQARRGLRDSLLTMATYEIDMGNVQAATSLLVDVVDVPHELSQRLLALEEQGRERDARLEALERDLDAALGQTGRAWLAMAIGVVWSCIWGYRYVVWAQGTYELAPQVYFFQHGLLVAAVAVASTLGWRRFAANAVGQRVILGVNFVLAMMWLNRLAALRSDMEMLAFFDLELVLLSISSGLIALGSDRRIFVVSVAYGLAALFSLALPAYSFLIYALSHAAALCPLAILLFVKRH